MTASVERCCQICGEDISGRPSAAKYCPSCAHEWKLIRQRLFNKARRCGISFTEISAKELDRLKKRKAAEKAAAETEKTPKKRTGRNAARKKAGAEHPLHGWTLSECAREAARRGLTYGQFVSLAGEGKIRPRKRAS